MDIPRFPRAVIVLTALLLQGSGTALARGAKDQSSWDDRCSSLISESEFDANAIDEPFFVAVRNGQFSYGRLSRLSSPARQTVLGLPETKTLVQPGFMWKTGVGGLVGGMPVSIRIVKKDGGLVTAGSVQHLGSGKIAYQKGAVLVDARPQFLGADDYRLLHGGDFSMIWDAQAGSLYLYRMINRLPRPLFHKSTGRRAVLNLVDGTTVGSHYDQSRGGPVAQISRQVIVTDIQSDGQIVFRHNGPSLVGRPGPESKYAGDVAWICAPGYVTGIHFGDSSYRFDPDRQAFVGEAKAGVPVTDVTLKDLTAHEREFLSRIPNVKLPEQSDVQQLQSILLRAAARRGPARDWDSLDHETRLELLRVVVAAKRRGGWPFATEKKIRHAGEPEAVVRAARLVESEAIQIMTAVHLLAGFQQLEYQGFSPGPEQGYWLTYDFRWEGLSSGLSRSVGTNRQVHLSRTRISFQFDAHGVFHSLKVVKDDAFYPPFRAATKAGDVLSGALTKVVAAVAGLDEKEKQELREAAKASAERGAKDWLIRYLAVMQEVRRRGNEWRPWSLLVGYEVTPYFRQ